MTKPNSFTKKRAKESLHSEQEDNKAKTKSFSLYPSDVKKIAYLTDELGEYSRKKMIGAIVVRTALALLEEEYKNNKENKKFMDKLQRIIAEND